MAAKALFLLSACLQAVSALHPPLPIAPVVEKLGTDAEVQSLLADPSTPESGIAYFDQFIDHENPDLGTFSQTYWYNATYWKGPGSPVVLTCPGEIAATGYTGYLTDAAISGRIAEEVGGAVVLIEHRFWGNSTPYVQQTTKNLQYLTLDQAVADFTHFARTVDLPFVENNSTTSSNAPDAPWIWSGGSYSGALGAWIESLSPGTYFATHSSSAPVQSQYDYWQYFQPIQKGMPQNCSEDYTAIIDYVDEILGSGSEADIADLKAMFNVTDLEHVGDIATAISSPIWAWQSIQMDDGYSTFYQMCDAIEGASAPSNSTNLAAKYPVYPGTSPRPVGLAKAFPNFVKWFTTSYLPGYCAGYGYEDWSDPQSVACFDTFNATSPMFTDLKESNAFARTWVWMTCNDPFFYYQTGAPEDRPTVFSRYITPEYYQRQCPLFFPREGEYTYGSDPTGPAKTAKELNARTGGWDFIPSPESHVFFVNGGFDPWREVSMASNFRPGGILESTEETPHIVIPGSRHCNEMRAWNYVNPDIKKAADAVIEKMGEWVDEFYSVRR